MEFILRGDWISQMQYSQSDLVFGGLVCLAFLLVVFLGVQLNSLNEKKNKEVCDLIISESESIVEINPPRHKEENYAEGRRGMNVNFENQHVEREFTNISNGVANSSMHISGKKPPIKNLISTFEDTKVDSDYFFHHLILAGLVFSDAVSAAFNFLSKSTRKSGSISSEERKILKERLDNKSIGELKKMLEGVELIEKCSKSQLINFIFTNDIVIENLKIEARREALMLMTNQELKSYLKGVKGISGLKKVQLVDKILSNEISN